LLHDAVRTDGSRKPQPSPVKTIPPHFSAVYEAVEEDVSRILGSESEDARYFNIGTPLDMETPVCIDLNRFVERSTGIFGKTGTGKTFLTRLVLCGLIHSGRAVTFIFDMHSEYGWSGQKESTDGKRTFVKGLKQLFGNRVAIFSLDPRSTRRRGASPDMEVVIPFDTIQVEDIAPLQDELRLHTTAIEAAYLIVAKYGSRWLEELLKRGEQTGDENGSFPLKDFADELGAHPESIGALYRKLKRLEHLPFLVKSDKKPSVDVIDCIMDYLKRGIHIVLEFGQQTSMLCYLLVSNIIARRIHEEYVKQTERYLATQNPADEPRQLVITIEEAHKFLNPAAARQTVFGTIAREMRKYYVSLLIVDQRPSDIDDEIMSQIGTKIIAQLNDEKDINAVLTGVSNSSGLRNVLASLESKQEALLIGHAVPMPVVIRTRDYDDKFYAEITASTNADKLAEQQAALWGG
ncbi:MAG TPA: ATP-binding protein, partial [Armatimonadetes bacterium]|nr:ATP-binding protein [Armatimonadota bacterium]